MDAQYLISALTLSKWATNLSCQIVYLHVSRRTQALQLGVNLGPKQSRGCYYGTGSIGARLLCHSPQITVDTLPKYYLLLIIVDGLIQPTYNSVRICPTIIEAALGRCMGGKAKREHKQVIVTNTITVHVCLLSPNCCIPSIFVRPKFFSVLLKQILFQ